MLIDYNIEKGRGGVILCFLKGLKLELHSSMRNYTAISIIRAQFCSGNNKSADYSSVRIAVWANEGKMGRARPRRIEKEREQETRQ